MLYSADESMRALCAWQLGFFTVSSVASEISRNVSRNFISYFAKFSNYFRENSRNEIYENFAKFRESDLAKLYRK
jgi:hypothetical protein